MYISNTSQQAYCNHSTTFIPRHVRQYNAVRFMDLVSRPAPGQNGRPESCIASSLLVMLRGDHAHFRRCWNNMGSALRKYSELLEGDGARKFFLELSVDAFLNHDYDHSLKFYLVFMLIRAAQNEVSLDNFLQSSPFLGPNDVGITINEALTRAKLSFPMHVSKILHGEEAGLLEAMQQNPEILCACLNTEDPYHQDFGKKTVIVDAVLERKRKSRLLNCAACNSTPPEKKEGGGSAAYHHCARCRRVRYCSKKCQRADWAFHKKMCGDKVADWWGRRCRGYFLSNK